MAEAKTTTNHDEIRPWVEARGGRPTVVKGTEGRDGEGLPRSDVAAPDDTLQPIGRKTFHTFDDWTPTFLHHDQAADGQESRCFRFVRRDAERERG